MFDASNLPELSVEEATPAPCARKAKDDVHAVVTKQNGQRVIVRNCPGTPPLERWVWNVPQFK